jgi:DnaJ-class molecular chaperone
LLAAYEVLADPKKRATYDQMGGSAGSAHFDSNFDFDSFFANFRESTGDTKLGGILIDRL